MVSGIISIFKRNLNGIYNFHCIYYSITLNDKMFIFSFSNANNTKNKSDIITTYSINCAAIYYNIILLIFNISF